MQSFAISRSILVLRRRTIYKQMENASPESKLVKSIIGARRYLPPFRRFESRPKTKIDPTSLEKRKGEGNDAIPQLFSPLRNSGPCCFDTLVLASSRKRKRSFLASFLRDRSSSVKNGGNNKSEFNFI